MCGICCCFFAVNESSKSNFQIFLDSLLPHLERRGPDHTGRKDFDSKNDHGTYYLSLIGTVLHLRGRKTPQPLIDECGNILLWNGEIFGGLEVKEDENDSLVLLNILSSHDSDVSHSEHILSTMAKVQGPWAFVYWQEAEQKLWFGRDYFGRRSLLWHLPSNSNDVLVVTSVAERNSTTSDKNLHFEEIPADGLYCVDLRLERSEQDYKLPLTINKFDWKYTNKDTQDPLFLMCPFARFNKQMPNEQDLQVIEENRRKFGPQKKGRMNENFGKERETLLAQDSSRHEAVEEYVVENNISSLEIAESKTELENVGIREASCNYNQQQPTLEDCAGALDAVFNSVHTTSSARNAEANCVPKVQSCHESAGLSTDSEGSQDSCVEMSNDILTPTEVSDRKTITKGSSQSSLLRAKLNSNFNEARGKFLAVLGEAVKKRVFNLPRAESDPVSQGSQETSSNLPVQMKDARVGILFSGGIDSMMIAALADKFAPACEAIDLINVAFELKSQPDNQQKRSGRKGKMKPNTTTKPVTKNFSVPDRITGLSGLEELQLINPARQWNFVEVDVTLEELKEMRSRHISHLVSPLNTVLDDSIGCALWFAARGRGCLHSSCSKDTQMGDEEQTYTSKAKVLLVGMGADEQLGGYARHRTRFINEGWSGLMNEMEMEVKRISKRNLGRDDRCISDHGREARFPFLDEEVVSFLNSLPVWIKTDPGLPRGTGEKLLLRQAARLLGLTSSSELPKRAIQFGSRIAKLESSSEKGSEACARLEF